MTPGTPTTASAPSINSRRSFINQMGKGALAAGILAPIAHSIRAQVKSGATGTLQQIPTPDDFKPIQLPPLDDATEKKDDPFAAPLNEKKKIGFAIVGLGHLTLGEIMPAFGASKYAKPVALVSGDAAKAAKLAQQYNISEKNIYTYENFDTIKSNPEIQAVYIVLPNSMHEEYTIRAAKAGKHVLCEKPMATSVAGAQRMIDACRQAGKKLMIAYRIQYEPNNRMIMNFVRNKTYGTIKIIEAYNGQHIGDPSQWRLKKAMGGGSLADVGIYCLNTARFLLGEEPEWVQASKYSTPGDSRFTEVDETVLFQMGFPGGAQVNCSCSFGVHQARRYRCLADKGGWFGMDPAFPYKGLKMEVSESKDNVEWRSNPSAGEKNHFALELDHLSLCIFFNKQPYTPGEEGLQDQRIIEAIFTSADTGKRVELEKIATMDAFRGTSPDNLYS